jgi:hypothetical protein
MLLGHLRALIAEVPKPLVIAFAVIFAADILLGLLTFQLSTLIRWALSWALMYGTLKGDKVWASVYAGLLFIGGVLTLLMFFSKMPLLAIPFVLVAWGLAAYILFSPSMNRFFTAKSSAKQDIQKSHEL